MSVLPFGAHRAYALAPLMGPMNERAVLVRGDVEATIRPEPCLDHGAVVVRRAGEEIMLERLAYLKGPDELLRQLYSSDAFTQQERDDLAQWLASGEATGQTVASAIGQGKRPPRGPRQG